jgi:hypothetical protein
VYTWTVEFQLDRHRPGFLIQRVAAKYEVSSCTDIVMAGSARCGKPPLIFPGDPPFQEEVYWELWYWNGQTLHKGAPGVGGGLEKLVAATDTFRFAYSPLKNTKGRVQQRGQVLFYDTRLLSPPGGWYPWTKRGFTSGPTGGLAFACEEDLPPWFLTHYRWFFYEREIRAKWVCCPCEPKQFLVRAVKGTSA